ncbi:MAG: hypothetical protein ACYDDF_15135 [Thermoplasmatota archaeon]
MAPASPPLVIVTSLLVLTLNGCAGCIALVPKEAASIPCLNTSAVPQANAFVPLQEILNITVTVENCGSTPTSLRPGELCDYPPLIVNVSDGEASSTIERPWVSLSCPPGPDVLPPNATRTSIIQWSGTMQGAPCDPSLSSAEIPAPPGLATFSVAIGVGTGHVRVGMVEVLPIPPGNRSFWSGRWVGTPSDTNPPVLGKMLGGGYRELMYGHSAKSVGLPRTMRDDRELQAFCDLASEGTLSTSSAPNLALSPPDERIVLVTSHAPGCGELQVDGSGLDLVPNATGGISLPGNTTFVQFQISPTSCSNTTPVWPWTILLLANPGMGPVRFADISTGQTNETWG